MERKIKGDFKMLFQVVKWIPFIGLQEIQAPFKIPFVCQVDFLKYDCTERLIWGPVMRAMYVTLNFRTLAPLTEDMDWAMQAPLFY